jgi:hypothetical protein
MNSISAASDFAETMSPPARNARGPLPYAKLRAADRRSQGACRGALGRCGFASHGVFVMDGSRRSAHGNAYFTGHRAPQAYRCAQHAARPARRRGGGGELAHATLPFLFVITPLRALWFRRHELEADDFEGGTPIRAPSPQRW